MPGLNVLDYLAFLSVTEKSFITLTAGVNVMKLFSSSLTVSNKLERLFLDSLSSLV